MSSLLGHLLLLGVGGGISPVGATICMMLLNTGRPLATAQAFLLGHATILTAAGIIALTGFGGIPSFGDLPQAVRHTVDVMIGMVLLTLALKQWLYKPDPNAPPKWRAMIDSMSPGKAFLFGTIRMVTDVGTLALFVSGLKEIAAAYVGVVGTAVTFTLFVLLLEMALVVPIVVYAVAPGRGGALLGSARRWLEENTRIILVAIFVVFGILLLAKGSVGLLG